MHGVCRGFLRGGKTMHGVCTGFLPGREVLCRPHMGFLPEYPSPSPANGL